MGKDRVPPALAFYADELKRARATAGLTQEAFAEQLHYSASLVGQVEAGIKYPSNAFSTVVDEFLETDGRFVRMAEMVRRAATPDWFRPWLSIEAEATHLRSFEPQVVTGLLQTEAYATALLQDEARVATRLERQAILRREKPPKLIVILDQSVLTRQVGDPDTMAEQLRYLVDHPVAHIQILPADANTYLGLDGPFVLANTADAEYAYLETPLVGFVVDSKDLCWNARLRWDALRGEALPQRQSRELILEEAEKWDSRTCGARPRDPAPPAATASR